MNIKISKIICIFLFNVGYILCVYPQSVSNLNSLLSNEGFIMYSDEQNSILVTDYPENIKNIEEFIEMVDVAPRQVLIEARVVEVKLDKERSMGVNWTLFEEDGGFQHGAVRIGSTAGTVSTIVQNIPYKGSVNPPIIGTDIIDPFTLAIFNDPIEVVLSTLANSLDTEVLSAPKISTVNNREAEIKVVKRIPWIEPIMGTDVDGNPIQVGWDANFEEVGIILKVNPRISEDGQISMELSPEVSEKAYDYEVPEVGASPAYTIPVIDTRTAETKVIIGDEQTIIIGGLIKDNISQADTKIPFLGDIPGIGWLFKSTKNTKEKLELLIFVSPKIITTGVSKAMKEQERFGVGKRYMDNREKQNKEILKEKQKNEEKVVNKLELLNQRLNDVIRKRENMEKIVIDIEG